MALDSEVLYDLASKNEWMIGHYLLLEPELEFLMSPFHSPTSKYKEALLLTEQPMLV